jgi:UDP-2,3-diacylglucosamine pyrophosphatase LpxH
LKKRRINIAVISDVHLGNTACHAEELITYLNSIHPEILVLNGDFIDVGMEARNTFLPSHAKVIKKITGMAENGTLVYYLRGKHESKVNTIGNIPSCNFIITDNLMLQFDGKKAWFLPGDVFGSPLPYFDWLAKLGSFGHTYLQFANRIGKWRLALTGRYTKARAEHPPTKAKKARHALNFERTLVAMAVKKGYDFVVCGHLHLPKKEIHLTKNGQCTYLNSGDWVAHLTALEYSFKRWKIYRYQHDKLSPFFADGALKEMDMHDLVASLGAMAKKSKDAVD